MIMPKTKTCSPLGRNQLQAPECLERQGVWPATREFFKVDKRAKDGLSSWCRACANAYNRAWRRRPEVEERDQGRRQTPEYQIKEQERNQTPKRREQIKVYSEARCFDQRAEMLALYGNACQRCGDTHLDLLEQHHSKGGHKDGYPDYPPALRFSGPPLVVVILKWVDECGCLPPDIELLCRKPCHRAADKELKARPDPRGGRPAVKRTSAATASRQ